jgi:hypothetical protein
VAQVTAILAKRKKGASVLPVSQFEELCCKLADKYGEAPTDVWTASQQQQQQQQPGSDSDDDYSEAFDDGIVPTQSPQQPRLPEPEPEVTLSRAEAEGQRAKLLAEIKKTETTMFSWKSIVESQSENREYLQQSLDGLVKRMTELHAELASLEKSFPVASAAQQVGAGVWRNVVESAVIDTPMPHVWSAIRTTDFKWLSTVSTTRKQLNADVASGTCSCMVHPPAVERSAPPATTRIDGVICICVCC